MLDHLGDSFFLPMQSFTMTHQMTGFTHPSSNHHKIGQPLALSGLVLILEVAEIMGLSWMLSTWVSVLDPVALFPNPYPFFQPSAQYTE